MVAQIKLTLLLALLVAADVATGQLSSPAQLASLQPPFASGAFSPSSVSGLVFWLDTDGLSGSDGDAIATFPDSINSRHFSHATAGNRAIITNSTSGFNNKKTLWFDGSNDFYTNRTYQTVAQNHTFYAVMRFKVQYNNFANGYLLSSSGSDMDIRPEDENVHKFTVFDGTAAREFAKVDDGLGAQSIRVVSVVMNSTGTALNVYTNGVSMGAATAWVQPAAGNYFTIGASWNAASAFFNGTIGDMLLYSGAHNTTDRQNIEDYLGTKFGVPITH